MGKLGKRDKVLIELPSIIGRVISRALLESKPMPATPQKVYRRRYGNPLWLTLMVWIGGPLLVGIIMGAIMFLIVN